MTILRVELFFQRHNSSRSLFVAPRVRLDPSADVCALVGLQATYQLSSMAGSVVVQGHKHGRCTRPQVADVPPPPPSHGEEDTDSNSDDGNGDAEIVGSFQVDGTGTRPLPVGGPAVQAQDGGAAVQADAHHGPRPPDHQPPTSHATGDTPTKLPPIQRRSGGLSTPLAFGSPGGGASLGGHDTESKGSPPLGHREELSVVVEESEAKGVHPVERMVQEARPEWAHSFESKLVIDMHNPMHTFEQPATAAAPAQVAATEEQLAAHWYVAQCHGVLPITCCRSRVDQLRCLLGGCLIVFPGWQRMPLHGPWTLL